MIGQTDRLILSLLQGSLCYADNNQIKGGIHIEAASEEKGLSLIAPHEQMTVQLAR